MIIFCTDETATSAHHTASRFPIFNHDGIRPSTDGSTVQHHLFAAASHDQFEHNGAAASRANMVYKLRQTGVARHLQQMYTEIQQ